MQIRRPGPEPIRGSKHIPLHTEIKTTHSPYALTGWDRKLVGVGQENRGPQTGLPYMNIRKDPNERPLRHTQVQGGWDRKLVGLGQENRGPQTGPQYRSIRKDPVAARASPYLRAAHSL